MLLKDTVLDNIAQEGGNIAQFVSYSPDGKKRYSRIRGSDPTRRFASVEEAIQAIRTTGAPYVNIRSFLPNKPDGNPLFMGRKERWASVVDTADVVRDLFRRGLHVIINEEINVADGGFSGVMFGDVAEFAPMDTPRCVEKDGCAVVHRSVMAKLVRTVYERRISIPFPRGTRVEFSVHPGPVGYFRQTQIIWQVEEKQTAAPKVGYPHWPNRYSEAMGDKAFGLLMAHLHGLRVPFCRVTGRVIPPFEFGEETGSQEVRMVRSCPKVQVPGHFFTHHGWLDVTAEMHKADPDGSKLASYIEQDRVDVEFAGASITGAENELITEGTNQDGERFMTGGVGVSPLPTRVTDAVECVWEAALPLFGPVRFEWVYDTTNTLWIVQFHAGRSLSHGREIVPGDAVRWERFDTTLGLERLRMLVQQARQFKFGIIVVGNVGITSHFGDILRRAGVPSRLERPDPQIT